jgi:hypothetical protein
MLYKSLKSNFIWKPFDYNSITSFLEEVVPNTSAQMMCMHGISAPIPTIDKAYVRTYPDLPISKYKYRVLSQVRRTSAFSIISMRETNSLNENNSDSRKKFKLILDIFKDDLHWENFYAIAISEHTDMHYNSAINYYEKACDIILKDKKVRDRKDFKLYLKDIRNLITKCREEKCI